MNFDPHSSWLALETAASRHNGELAAHITLVRDHMEYEITGRLEDLMSTLTSEPVYHFWGNGEPMVIAGRDAVHAFYAGMMAAGGQQFQVVCDNVIAAPTHVITEGQVRQVYAAAALQAQGVDKVADVDVTAHDFWVSNAQLVTVWPIAADGKLVGEDIYFGQPPLSTLAPIARDAIPDYYRFH